MDARKRRRMIDASLREHRMVAKGNGLIFVWVLLGPCLYVVFGLLRWTPMALLVVLVILSVMVLLSD